ncbi:MAG: acyltransferase [Desulfobacteraceae bacterium]|jgi:acetyltransferase-like isoleucine patch superfamily enzyme|nr:acyltransferase [Desulfobacteraceae bacterium]
MYYGKIFNAVDRKVKGKRNIIQYSNAILSNVKIDIRGDNNSIIIEKNSILNGTIFFIRGDNHKVHSGPACRMKNGCIWFEDSSCCLSIGSQSSFGDVHIALTEPNSCIEIGNDCMFAYDIDLRTGDSHSIIDSISGNRINFAGNIIINDHVWVGAHSVILKGVSLPENSIVATGSIVVKSFKDSGVIIAGNPAKEVRRGVSWTRSRGEAN